MNKSLYDAYLVTPFSCSKIRPIFHRLENTQMYSCTCVLYINSVFRDIFCIQTIFNTTESS